MYVKYTIIILIHIYNPVENQIQCESRPVALSQPKLKPKQVISLDRGIYYTKALSMFFKRYLKLISYHLYYGSVFYIL